MKICREKALGKGCYISVGKNTVNFQNLFFLTHSVVENPVPPHPRFGGGIMNRKRNGLATPPPPPQPPAPCFGVKCLLN